MAEGRGGPTRERRGYQLEGEGVQLEGGVPNRGEFKLHVEESFQTRAGGKYGCSWVPDRVRNQLE